MSEIIDHSPPGLVDALCRRIDSVLAPSFWQPGEFKDEGIHVPHVHAQYLPVSKTESRERVKTKDFPLVQVICMAGVIDDLSETANGSEINIQIYFGGYCKDTDNQGWRIPIAMLWRVLQDLLADTIIAGYQLIAPLEWSPLNSKDPPYYTAMLETVWRGAPPTFEVPYEGIMPREENEEITGAQDSDKNESGEG